MTAKVPELTRPMLQRLPVYLKYLKTLPPEIKFISATSISSALELGEVQVRKDLGAVSGLGRPKLGYETSVLVNRLEKVLGFGQSVSAVVIGAGKLGRAICEYGGFAEYGIEIIAAFDTDESKQTHSDRLKPVYPMSELKSCCLRYDVQIAVIAVPEAQAQTVCDAAVAAGIGAIWNFAPKKLSVPESVLLKNENLASSLALLAGQLRQKNRN